MKTPKEKADELVEKMTIDFDMCRGQNIQCAIIAVDEIVKLDIFDCNDEWSDEPIDTREYWNEVKNELNKML